MAPTAPKKRPSIRAKSKTTTANSGSGLIARPPPPRREGAVISDSFISSKKDKRTIKHSTFVNRIEKAQKKPLKRRRPNKKLITTLESLGDVLGEMEAEGMGEKMVEGGKIRQRSLKSRPGATKRREKVEAMERERFGRNMAVLTAGAGNENATVIPVQGEQETQPQANPTASRWAALRGFISQTMEQKEEFIKS